MTDPTTTTRDGDVLTELDDCIFALNTAISAARHEARLDAVSSNEAVESLDRLITSHRALQQQLDAAEQRAERMYNAIDWATTETFTTPVDLPEECFPRSTWNRIYERLRAALTEQERDDA